MSKFKDSDEIKFLLGAAWAVIFILIILSLWGIFQKDSDHPGDPIEQENWKRPLHS